MFHKMKVLLLMMVMEMLMEGNLFAIKVRFGHQMFHKLKMVVVVMVLMLMMAMLMEGNLLASSWSASLVMRSHGSSR